MAVFVLRKAPVLPVLDRKSALCHYLAGRFPFLYLLSRISSNACPSSHTNHPTYSPTRIYVPGLATLMTK